MANRKGADTYSIFYRLMFILENKGFFLSDYISRFEISRRTAFRDINFINNYKDYVLKFENNRYNLYKGVEHEAD